jgi:hypothetical protein
LRGIQNTQPKLKNTEGVLFYHCAQSETNVPHKMKHRVNGRSNKTKDDLNSPNQEDKSSKATKGERGKRLAFVVFMVLNTIFFFFKH